MSLLLALTGASPPPSVTGVAATSQAQTVAGTGTIGAVAITGAASTAQSQTASGAGVSTEPPAVLTDTHDGFWAKEWKRIRAREKRKYKEEIEERIEVIADEIEEVQAQIVQVKQASVVKFTPARNFYAEQERIVQHLIARRNQLIEEEDEELLLLL